jgi:hypothetical protein
MARRGFEPSVARRVIDTRTPDGLEDLEAEASGTA